MGINEMIQQMPNQVSAIVPGTTPPFQECSADQFRCWPYPAGPHTHVGNARTLLGL